MNSSPFITPWRIGTLYGLMAISIIAFTGQLLRLQVIEHEEFLKTIKLEEKIGRKIQENEEKVPERWIFITVKEAYIHCSKHIPLLKKLDKEIHWGTDKEVYKGGDFFKAKKPE